MGCSPSTSAIHQKRTDSEISDNQHTSKTSVNIIETQKKETDMTSNDPSSALITESDKDDDDDDDDSLFDSEIDTDGVIGKAIPIMEIIKSEQNQRTTDGLFTSEFRKSAFLLDEILSYVINKKSSEEKSDMLQRFTKHIIEYQIIKIYCKVCVETLETSDKSVIPLERLEDISIVLSFFVNSSDDNSEMCSAISEQPHFLEVLTKQLVDWTEPYSKQTLDHEYSQKLELICTILHNVAMFDDNVEKIRSVGCIEAMKPYLDSKDKTIRLLCLATLADLVNESESEILKSNGDVITFLMWTISMAMKAKGKSWDGWSLKELARIVRQVARNDNNKKTVVQHGAIPLFIAMTKCDNIEEQKEAVRVIWTLSFDKENRSEMVANKDWEVIETLEKLKQSPDDEIRKISKKALWTIQDKDKATNGKPVTSKNDDTHIMISYNWGHQSTVKQISENLRNNGIKVWMDVDDMQGSTLQAMASAVEKADIVLMCYSFKYKNSDNCRAEAEYAFQLKKKIIPLKMEGNYKADGWLGFIIGAKLFYDFSGKYRFENKVKELVREVHEGLGKIKGKLVEVPDEPVVVLEEPISETIVPVMSSATTTNTQKQTKRTKDSVKKWKPAEVERWLDDNNLPKKLLGRLRGKDVAFLYLLVHESPTTFYQTIKDQLGVKDIQTMTDLRFALDDLDIMDTNASSL